MAFSYVSLKTRYMYDYESKTHQSSLLPMPLSYRKVKGVAERLSRVPLRS